MLFLLREEGGFDGEMLGVDYSAQSVELCRRLADSKGLGKEDGQGKQEVEFEIWDISQTQPRHDWFEAFDIVLDKGTFDAISLSADIDYEGKRVCEGYRERVECVVKQGGYVVVTSCNWTERELKSWFAGEQSGLEAVGRVEYPVFKFGGQTGQSVSTVCFKKEER